VYIESVSCDSTVDSPKNRRFAALVHKQVRELAKAMGDVRLVSEQEKSRADFSVEIHLTRIVDHEVASSESGRSPESRLDVSAIAALIPPAEPQASVFVGIPALYYRSSQILATPYSRLEEESASLDRLARWFAGSIGLATGIVTYKTFFSDEKDDEQTNPWRCQSWEPPELRVFEPAPG